MSEIILIVVVVPSIWVLVDAKKIGVNKGQIQELGNPGAWGWFFVCLLFWVVGFPFYLAKRSAFKRFNNQIAGDQTDIDEFTRRDPKWRCCKSAL